MIRFPIRLPMALLLTSLLIPPAQAQSASTISVQDIINKVNTAQKAAKDLSFRLAGTASFAANGQTASQKFDLTVKSIPAQNVARLQFSAPDALADNVVVADKNELRQYLFLTNQVMVTPVNKAAGNAGLDGLDWTQLSNTSAMLSSYNVKLVGTAGSAGSRVFQLEASPKAGGSSDRARVWITEAGWRPNRIQWLDQSGKPRADLTISNYKVNSGLSAAALRALPKDAQIVRQ